MRSGTKPYLLYHWRDEADDETAKPIGVFSSLEAAEGAKRRLSGEPGFRSQPDRFIVDEYPVDHVNWTEGFVVAD